METEKTKNPNTLNIGLIGAGALGNAMALRLFQAGFNIYSVVSRSSRSARRLASKVNCKKNGTDFKLVQGCDAVFITVPDSQIHIVANELTKITFRSKKVIAVHTSGTLTSAVLNKLKQSRTKNIFIASMHPMQSFPKKTQWNKQTLANQFDNIYFGIEGNTVALKVIIKIIKAIGSRPIVIPKSKKTLYHLGGVFSSNFLVALLYITKQIYRKIGLTEKMTIAVLYPIIRQTLLNMNKNGISSSLTGPAARRDHTTIKHQLDVLRKFDPQYEILYENLTRICFTITNNK